MGDDDFGSPSESRPADAGAPPVAPGRGNPWLQPNALTEVLAVQEAVLSASIAAAAQAAKQAEEQLKRSFSLAEHIALESFACARARAAIDQAEAILSVLGGAASVGTTASTFAAGIVASHDPRQVAREASDSSSSPADQAPAMVWRTYAAQSFSDLATRAQRFSVSVPAAAPIARTLASAPPSFAGASAPRAAPAPARASLPPVQTLRSLAQAARSAASPLLAEGFGARLGAAFATAGNLFERTAQPSVAAGPAAPNLQPELEAEWDKLHALLIDMSKNRFEAAKSHPAKKGAMDAFRGHSHESVANAPNQDLASSLKGVRALASQLLEYNAGPAPAPVRLAKRTAAALSELSGALENAAAMSSDRPGPSSGTRAKHRGHPEPAFRKAISVGATNALARTAAFGHSIADSVDRVGKKIAAGVRSVSQTASAILAPQAPGLALAGAGALGIPAPSPSGQRPASGATPPSPTASGSATAISSNSYSFVGGPSESGGPMPDRRPYSRPGAAASADSSPLSMPSAASPSAPSWPGAGGLPKGQEKGWGRELGLASRSTAPPSPDVPASPSSSPPPAFPGAPPSPAPSQQKIVPFVPDIGLPQVPVAPQPVPIPYPNIALNSMPGSATATILLPNLPAAESPSSAPPIPSPGLTSRGISPPASFLSASPTVLLEGKPASVAADAPPSPSPAPSPPRRPPGIQLSPIDGAAPPPWTPGAPQRPEVSPLEAGPSGAGPRDSEPEANPAALRDSLIESAGPGFVPDSAMRQNLMPHLGFDPAMARFHTGPEAADAAQEQKAQAFTIGRDVFFGKDRFAPDTREGLALIGHEVTHVGQQTGALGDRVQKFSERGGDEMEREAREVAKRVYNHHPGALQVQEYVCEFVSESGKFGSDEDRRLERLSMEAFAAAEKALANWNGDLGTVVVDLVIAPAEMSDALIVQRWRDAIVHAVMSAAPPSPVSRAESAAVQKFDSYEHVQLGDGGGGDKRKFKTKRHKEAAALPPGARQYEYQTILSAMRGNADDQKIRGEFLDKGLTYGEIVALSGDHYETFDDLDNADLLGLTRLVPLVRRKTSDYEFMAANPNYMHLAYTNAAHFSDRSNPINNLTRYRAMHKSALEDSNPVMAQMKDAASAHFLTDAFSSGHMRVKRAALDKAGQPTSTLGTIAMAALGAVPGLYFGLRAALYTHDPSTITQNVEAEIKDSPHILGGWKSKQQHDFDNEHGVKVKNKRGDQWVAYGDDHLNFEGSDLPDVKANKEFNKQIAIEAVRVSKREVDSMFTATGKHKDRQPTSYAAEMLIPMPITDSTVQQKPEYKSWQQSAEDVLKKALDPMRSCKDVYAVINDPSKLASLTLEQKREYMRRLTAGLVTEKARAAIATLYNSCDQTQKNALSLEFGAYFSPSAYKVDSAAKLVPPVDKARAEYLRKQPVFWIAVEFPSSATFKAESGDSMLSRRADGLKIADRLLDKLLAMGKLDLHPKDPKSSKLSDALDVLEELSDTLGVFLDKVGSMASVEARSAAIELKVRAELWIEVLRTAGSAPKAKPKKSYAESFEGTAGSILSRVGSKLAVAVPKWTGLDAEIQLKVPVHPGVSVGGGMALTVDREDDAQIGAELKALVSVGAKIGELEAFGGVYVESKAKDPPAAMELISYGMYQQLRASKVVPSWIVSRMWGGLSGSDDEAYVRAESWSVAEEMARFTPLFNALEAAKKKQPPDPDAVDKAEEAVKNTYVELGGMGGGKGSFLGDALTVEAMLRAGTRYDAESIAAATGAPGQQFVKRFVGDERKPLGRAVESFSVSGEWEMGIWDLSVELEGARAHEEAEMRSKTKDWDLSITGHGAVQVPITAVADSAQLIKQHQDTIERWVKKVLPKTSTNAPPAAQPAAAADTAVKVVGGVVDALGSTKQALDLAEPLGLKGSQEAAAPSRTALEFKIGTGTDGWNGSAQLMTEFKGKLDLEVFSGEVTKTRTLIGVEYSKGEFKWKVPD